MKILIILFMIFFYTPFALAHGGEDHSEPEKKPAITTPVKTPNINQPLNIEKVVQTNNGNFKFNITQTPSQIKVGEPVTFNIQVSETIEDSFEGEELVEGGQLNIQVKKSNQQLDKNVIAQETKPGNYSFSYTFSEGDSYQFNASLDISDKRKVPVIFPVIVQNQEINYKALALDVLIILLAITAIFLFYRKAVEHQPEDKVLKNTLGFGIVTLALVITSIAVIHKLIKPEEPVIVEMAENTNLMATNNINLPKESQLLFNISTAPAAQKEIISGLTVNGVIKARPQAKTQIQSVASGRVKLSNFSVGSFVSQGQTVALVEQLLSLPEEVSLQSTLADLRSRLGELQSKVEPARARLRSSRLELERSKTDLQARSDQLQTEIDQAKAKLNTARVELERSKKLYDIGGAPFKRVQEAQLQVKLNELELSSAQKQKTYTVGSEALKRVRDAELEVKLNEQEIISAQKQIDIASQNKVSINQNRSFTLTSPISGTVTEIAATSGQQVEANEHIITIMNLSSVWLEAQVFEKDLNTITSAQKASFRLSAYPKDVFNIGSGTQNRLLTVGNTVDPERRTIPVTYEISNTGGRIREGMFAEITIDTSGGKKVINIPKEAISEESGIKYVYVFKGGETFEKRQVSVGSQGQKDAEIISGIKPGERVVTAGLYQLKSSMISRK